MAATFKSGALIGTETPALSGWRERVPVIIGVFVVVIFLPWFQLFGPGHVQILGTAGVSMTRVLVFSITYMWAQTLFVLILVFFWERRSLASLGIRMPSGADLGWAVIGYLLVMLGAAIAFMVLPPEIRRSMLQFGRERIAALATVPFPIRLAVLLTAAITEEILYRGYAIERLEMLTRSTLLSGAIAFVVFVALHAQGWGLMGMAGAAPIAMVLVALYLSRRSLIACMVMHLLQDAPGVLLAPWIAQHLR